MLIPFGGGGVLRGVSQNIRQAEHDFPLHLSTLLKDRTNHTIGTNLFIIPNLPVNLRILCSINNFCLYELCPLLFAADI